MPTFCEQTVGPPKHVQTQHAACSVFDVRLASSFNKIHEAVTKAEHRSRCQEAGRQVSEAWILKQDELLVTIAPICRQFLTREGADVRDVQYLRDVREVVRDQINARRKKAQQARLKAWREKIVASSEGGDKSYVYKWLKSQSHRPAANVMFKREDGSITANHSEALKLLVEAWSPIYNKHQDCPIEATARFAEEYAVEISQLFVQGKLEDISPDEMFRKCQSKNTKTVGGLDAWSVAEVQQLPLVFWKAFASIVAIAESGGGWPRVFGQMLISSIPKPGPAVPLNCRGIGLASVFYSIYASVRYDNSMSWMLKMLPDDPLRGTQWQGHDVQ
jgi:hypothetical protein